MKCSLVSISFILLSIANMFLSAQSANNISLNDTIYVPTITSVHLNITELPYGQPVIKLKSEDLLLLSFDDLNTEHKNLRYTVIHCSHQWKESNLNQIEYIEGYNEDDIKNYSYSFNTTQSYIHYELLFPNDYMSISKSGNYILYVFENDKNTPVLTRRFMVCEPVEVPITAEANRASDVNLMYSHQEVNFTVKSGMYKIYNPKMYLHATVMQNGRWDNAIIGLTPRSSQIGEFFFNYDNGINCMQGGADFRVFDIRTLFSNADRIVSIAYTGGMYHAYVLEDKMRGLMPYFSNTTLRGRCFFKNVDYSDKNREDYVIVHFALKPDYPIPDGNIYVYGELTDWKLRPDAKLTFNPDINYWETTLFLKQGYYNYQYVYVKNKSNIIDAAFLEGSHWQTDNEYMVLIYLQDEGSYYDKLVGYKYIYFKK